MLYCETQGNAVEKQNEIKRLFVIHGSSLLVSGRPPMNTSSRRGGNSGTIPYSQARLTVKSTTRAQGNNHQEHNQH